MITDLRDKTKQFITYLRKLLKGICDTADIIKSDKECIYFIWYDDDADTFDNNFYLLEIIIEHFLPDVKIEFFDNNYPDDHDDLSEVDCIKKINAEHDIVGFLFHLKDVDMPREDCINTVLGFIKE